MWQVLGVVVGGSLAWGVASRAGQALAVRVLCAVAALAVLLALLVLGLVGGKGSPWGPAFGALLLSFGFSSLAFGIGGFLRRSKYTRARGAVGAVAMMVAGFVVVSLLRFWLA